MVFKRVGFKMLDLLCPFGRIVINIIIIVMVIAVALIIFFPFCTSSVMPWSACHVPCFAVNSCFTEKHLFPTTLSSSCTYICMYIYLLCCRDGSFLHTIFVHYIFPKSILILCCEGWMDWMNKLNLHLAFFLKLITSHKKLFGVIYLFVQLHYFCLFTRDAYT